MTPGLTAGRLLCNWAGRGCRGGVLQRETLLSKVQKLLNYDLKNLPIGVYPGKPQPPGYILLKDCPHGYSESEFF